MREPSDLDSIRGFWVGIILAFALYGFVMAVAVIADGLG